MRKAMLLNIVKYLDMSYLDQNFSYIDQNLLYVGQKIQEKILNAKKALGESSSTILMKYIPFI